MTTGRKETTSYRIASGWHQTGRWSTAIDPDAHSSTIVFADDDNESLNILRANGRVDRTFLDKGLLSFSGGYMTGMSEFYPFGALGNYLIKDVQSGYGRVDLAYEKFQFRSFYNKLTGYDDIKRLKRFQTSDGGLGYWIAIKHHWVRVLI